MKKLGMFLLISCLFCTVAQAAAPEQATLERAIFNAKKAKTQTIVRDKENPFVLWLLGNAYTLHKSKPQNSRIGNLYLPPGNYLSTDNAIFISKITDTTCAQEINEINDDEIMTFDSRNPQDQIISGETQEDDLVQYVVARFIQVGPDVFSLVVILPRTTQTDEEWHQFERAIFQAVRHTPTEVITQNFVETVCKFGSDCYE